MLTYKVLEQLTNFARWTAVVLVLLIGTIWSAARAETVNLLNVSYDPTREFYSDFNAAFSKHWKAKTGQDIKINQSHGGSGKQARSVIDGLPADVVTLALAGDVDALSTRGKLVPTNWQQRLPNNSAPYTSTIVFLVRKGNPKKIRDWNDLIKPSVGVITPNPKTSGGARWNYLAGWAWALKQPNGNASSAQNYVRKLFTNIRTQNLPLDTGARGATTTFVRNGIGDVLLAWENEALLTLREVGVGKFEIVVPSVSVLAEPSVAVVDKTVLRRGTREPATAYLQYLYSKTGQELIAKHYYRPRDAEVAKRYATQFPKLQLTTIAEFGGWNKVQNAHFAEGGIFDRIYAQ